VSVNVEIDYSKTFEVARGLEQAFEYFWDVEKSIPPNFFGLQTFERLEPSVYEWTFHDFKYGGYGIRIFFMTRFQSKDKNLIEMIAVNNPSPSQLSGRWKFAAHGEKTRVSFEAKLHVDLPVPFFLKSVAVPLAEKELTKIFDRYIVNVGKALSE